MRMLYWLIFAGILAAVTPAVASDALDGTYLLDPKASDDPTAIMKIMGMNAAVRAVAKKMKTRMVLDGEPDQVTLTLSSPVGSNESVMRTDGSETVVDGGEFGSGSMRAWWSEDGAALIVESSTQMPDGRSVGNVTTRRLEDADTLLQRFDVTIEGEEPITLRRIFRRIEE